MNPLALLLVFAPLYDSAQITNKWNIKTDSILQEFSSYPINQFIFNDIVDRRRNYPLETLLDTAAQLIRVREMFDRSTGKSDLIVSYFNGLDKEELLEDWKYLPIDSIKPRNYIMYLGCVPNKKMSRKVRKWERSLNKEMLTKESYYIIDTLIDKETQTVRVSFQIPTPGRRNLEAYYSPLGKSRKPYLKEWYY